MGNLGLVVALFDLDGTLCNARYIAASLVSYQFKNPARIPRVVIYSMTQLARWLFYKGGSWPTRVLLRLATASLPAC